MRSDAAVGLAGALLTAGLAASWLVGVCVLEDRAYRTRIEAFLKGAMPPPA